MMDDDSFEDSFESSSDLDSETPQQEIIPAYSERDDLTQSGSAYPSSGQQPMGISSVLFQPRIQNQSIPLEVESSPMQQLGMKLSLSPKLSPKTKRKFRPHFKKPQGLGNITQKIKKKKKKVFGVSLQTAVYRSQLGTDDIELPTVFRECIDFLEEEGLEHQGLYRLGGVKSQIEGIKALYDKGAIVDLTEYDVNAIASLLKLYLRELPEPLIPLSFIPQYEAVATKTDTAEIQLELLKQLLEDIPVCNRLLLGWLLVHLSHISDRSKINKMGISNLVIVFSPTLQIPIQVMHLLFNHRQGLFPDIEIKKYVRPQQQQSTPFDIPDPDTLETEEEISAELTRLSDMLEKLHSKVHGRNYDERDEYCWELQRVVTELKRKKKLQEKMSASKLGDEQEFMKTLMIMDATLQAENEELKSKNNLLKDDIRQEAEMIERYKSELRLYAGRERLPSPDDVEEESEISKLLWQKRELQSQYNSLIDQVEKEEKLVLQLRIKLKVFPIEQSLSVTE